MHLNFKLYYLLLWAFFPDLRRAQSQTGNGNYVNVGFQGDEYSTDTQRKKNVNRLSSFEPGQEWISTMKENDTMQYQNSTIERELSKKGKPEPLSEVKPHIYDDMMDRNIPKTPDTVLDENEDRSAAAAEVSVEVLEVPSDEPETPNYPSPPPIAAEISTSPDPQSPTSPQNPDKRWSQSQDQMIAY